MKNKLFRITTIPMSLKHLLTGQMNFMSKNGFEVIMASSDGFELNEVIKNEKCDHYIIPFTRKITILKDFISLIILFRLLLNEKPTIVHTHTPKAGIIGMLASYLANVPIRLHTVAGLPLTETTGFKRLLLNFVEKLTYRFSTNVYPNSHGLKKFILKNKFTDENKLKIIGNGSSNGIDTSYFDPKKISEEQKKSLSHKLGIKENDFVFIFVGRIVSDKGINELVEAYNSLSLVQENTRLLLVGPYEDNLDPIKKQTFNLIKKNDKIISLGYQNDVRPYFKISNVLVFPSYREGFPNVVMQAGAMGLPSIVSDINGCNEIIENNLNGIIIPPKSIKHIYNAMLKLYNDNFYFKKLKSNSRTIVKKKYERKLFWKLLLNEYQILLDEQK